MPKQQDYFEYSKEDLIAEITELKKRKKYGLVWDKVREPEKVVLRCKKELPVLKEVKSKAIKNDPANPTHIIIEGDNYHALSVLNYTHQNAIDVIYIDPPYNTGSTAWLYNNNYVDKEDSFKHSKWITMMYKRIVLAKNLLSDNGIIICAIDDYEIHNIRHIMDEVFGDNNRLSSIVVVHNPGGRQDDKFVATAHEYMVLYAKKESKALIKYLDISEKKQREYIYSDALGRYKTREFQRSGSNSRRIDRKNMWYSIYVDTVTKRLEVKPFKNSVELLPIDKNGVERVWRWGKQSFIKRKDNYIEVIIDGDNIKLFAKEREVDNKGEKPKSLWYKPSYSAVNGTNELKKIFGTNKDGAKIFDYPKSPYLLKDVLKIAANKNSIILDFFAGSGTTGQAVLELNNEDGGNRQLILSTNNELSRKKYNELKKNNATNNEMIEEGICRKVCYPRIRKNINGYKYKGKKRTLLFEEKLNITKLNRISDIYETYLETKMLNKDHYDNLKGELKDNTLLLYGINDIQDTVPGLNGNLKFYRTEFVSAKPTDSNMEKLTNQSVEMLCLKENTFISVFNSSSIKIFKNKDHYTGIIFYEHKIPEFKEMIIDFKLPVNVYVFSLGDDDFAEEFSDMLDKVEVCSIPRAIINTYKRIFR
ncbi:MAG: site-specific DNA-methyltransferase [Bacteroidetes bacterium]|nr:site-specific DNA-methyltransferase [Bacteroidota bacterium]